MSQKVAILSPYSKFGLVVLLNVPFLCILAIYDTVGSIGPQLQREGIVENVQQIGLLYTACSISTPVMVVVSGIVVDKWGQKVASLMCLLPMVLGGLMIWFSDKDFWIFFSGRVFTGLADALYVVQSRLIGILFEGEWLSFAFALTTVIGQFGNIVVFTLLPLLAAANLWAALGASFYLAMIAVISIGGFFLLDACHGWTKKEGLTKPFAFSDIKKLPLSFWCMNAINCFSTCSIFVVMSFGPTFLVEQNFTEVESGLVVSGMNAFVLISPLTCWVIDKIGHRCLIWGLCHFALIGGFIMLSMDLTNPVIWLFLIGFAFAILNPSIYATIPLVVPEQILGTAYGLVGVIFDVALLAYPAIIGAIMSEYGEWSYVHLFFAGTNMLGLLSCVLVFLTDTNNIFLVPTAHIAGAPRGGYQVIEDVELDEK